MPRVTRRDMVSSEREVQKLLDTLPASYRKRLGNSIHGFDVGINRAGKPFIIEANPTAADGMSGMVASNPLVQDAMPSHLRGSLPNYIRARLGLQAAGAAAPVVYTTS